jgi:hypothetical protein
MGPGLSLRENRDDTLGVRRAIAISLKPYARSFDRSKRTLG